MYLTLGHWAKPDRETEVPFLLKDTIHFGGKSARLTVVVTPPPFRNRRELVDVLPGSSQAHQDASIPLKISLIAWFLVEISRLQWEVFSGSVFLGSKLLIVVSLDHIGDRRRSFANRGSTYSSTDPPEGLAWSVRARTLSHHKDWGQPNWIIFDEFEYQAIYLRHRRLRPNPSRTRRNTHWTNAS